MSDGDAKVTKDAPSKRRKRSSRASSASKMAKVKDDATTEATASEKASGEKENPVSTGLDSVAVKDILVEENFNPRSDLGDLSALTANISQHGLLQPLLVRPKDDKMYVVCGHRRLQACINAGVKEIAVVVREMEDMEALAIAVSENSEDSRTKLETMDEALAFLKIKEINPEYDAVKIGRLCGCHAQKVRTSLKMLDAPEQVQKAVREGVLSKYAVVELQTMPPEVRTKALPEVMKRAKEAAESGTDLTKAAVRKIGNDIVRSDRNLSNDSGKNSSAPGFAKEAGLRTIWRGKSDMKKTMYHVADLLLDARDSKEDSTFLEGAFAAFMYCSGLSDKVKITKDMEQALIAIDKELELQEKGEK